MGGKSITEIDLSELVNTVELKLLKLDNNRLRNIDLSPLTACDYIEQIWLGSNELSSIDLTPLSGCLKLRELHLHANELVGIDLLPLSSCRNLGSLWLLDNYLSDIDLSPLSECKRLKSVFLSGNRLKSVNLSALLSIPLLQSVLIDPEVKIIAQSTAWKSRFKSEGITEVQNIRSIEFRQVAEKVRLYHAPEPAIGFTPTPPVPKRAKYRIQSGSSPKTTEAEQNAKTIMKEKSLTASEQKLDETREAYKVALSFAGEQREYVREVAKALESMPNFKGKVFFDEFHRIDMWGRDLNELLNEVFDYKSEYCVFFISRDYAQRHYPTQEKRSALSDKVKFLKGRILPVRFDDTELPGLSSSIVYVRASDYNPVQLANLIATRVNAPD